jgi:GntR family transcriptional repressor for pyruvate dehydrogenase complex
MFNAVRFNKVSQQIVSQIRGRILEGRLSPGDRLPSESALVEEFQVSKQTLREALRALECMGLIEVKKGVQGGPYIVEVDADVTKEVLTNFLYFKNLSVASLSEMRKIIEPYAAGVAATLMGREGLDRLADIIEVARNGMPDEYSVDLAENDLDFHRVIASATGNPILALVVDLVESLLGELKGMMKPDSGFSLAVLLAHERIFKAIQAGDEKRASSEMYEHVVRVEEELAKLEDRAGLWRKRR